MQIKSTETPSSYSNVLGVAEQAKLILSQNAMIFFCLMFSSIRSPSGLLLHFILASILQCLYVIPPMNANEHPSPTMSSSPLHALPKLFLLYILTATYSKV